MEQRPVGGRSDHRVILFVFDQIMAGEKGEPHLSGPGADSQFLSRTGHDQKPDLLPGENPGRVVFEKPAAAESESAVVFSCSHLQHPEDIAGAAELFFTLFSAAGDDFFCEYFHGTPLRFL